MGHFMTPRKFFTCVAAALFAAFVPFSSAQEKPADSRDAGWQHSGSMFILTTPEGAGLPAGTSVEEFPVLVRLNKEWFDFS